MKGEWKDGQIRRKIVSIKFTNGEDLVVTLGKDKSVEANRDIQISRPAYMRSTNGDTLTLIDKFGCKYYIIFN